MNRSEGAKKSWPPSEKHLRSATVCLLVDNVETFNIWGGKIIDYPSVNFWAPDLLLCHQNGGSLWGLTYKNWMNKYENVVVNRDGMWAVVKSIQKVFIYPMEDMIV